MLTRFSVENFLSFRERAEFSMIAGKSSRLKNHIIDPVNYNDFRRVKSAIIYGANAAGKSNIIRSIDFMKKIILNGTKPDGRIPVKKFSLEHENKRPSRFEIEISINNSNYAYGFSLNEKHISEEWLYLANKKKEEKIYHRQINENEELTFEYSGMKFLDDRGESMFKTMAELCPGNQLLLTEYINSRKRIKNYIDTNTLQPLEDLFQWFSVKLQIIFPETRFLGSPTTMPDIEDGAGLVSDLLNCFDTGITKIKLNEISAEKIKNILPAEIFEKLDVDIKEGQEGVIVDQMVNDRYLITRKNDRLIFQKICAEHETPASGTMELDFVDESDGTKRLLDLIPAYLDLFKNTGAVLIIDEIDRSLHSQIATSLLKSFYDATPNGSSQIIVTTHETNLLDQDLVRKDEVWFVDKKRGVSSIYSLEEFLPRYDKDIRSAYLKGRFGATPVIYKDPSNICIKIGKKNASRTNQV